MLVQHDGGRTTVFCSIVIKFRLCDIPHKQIKVIHRTFSGCHFTTENSNGWHFWTMLS